jgi:hypothetical protein
MPPIFENSSFRFTEGESVPEHIEGYPRAEERDTTKIWLEGEDTFDGEFYTLAIDLDDMASASLLRTARLRHLEETQPSAHSGGQTTYGIQDRVHIRMPQRPNHRT